MWREYAVGIGSTRRFVASRHSIIATRNSRTSWHTNHPLPIVGGINAVRNTCSFSVGGRTAWLCSDRRPVDEILEQSDLTARLNI